MRTFISRMSQLSVLTASRLSPRTPNSSSVSIQPFFLNASSAFASSASYGISISCRHRIRKINPMNSSRSAIRSPILSSW